MLVFPSTSRLKQRLSHPLVTAVLLWLLLDLLLFLSGYILYSGEKSFLPFGGIVNLEQEGLRSILFLNHNHNPFRLSGDWFILSISAAFSISYIDKRVLKWVLSLAYFLLFAYSLYYSIYFYIYGTHPFFVSNALLITNVFPIFLGTLGLSKWMFVTTIIAMVGILLYLFSSLISLFLDNLDRSTSHPLFFPLLFFTATYIALGTYLYRQADLNDRRLNIQWWLPRIVESSRSFEDDSWLSDPLKAARLQSKCDSISNSGVDIYLIVIESYGAIATEFPPVSQRFRSFLDSLDKRLSREGWHISSGYSKSPIKGGRSWLSFTTLLTGQHIDNQYSYEQFLADGSSYPHMINCLNEKGYHTTWMNTMRPPHNEDLEIQDSLMDNTWNPDEWIQFQDIDYRGRKVDPFGGIPDQYALTLFKVKQRSQTIHPQFLFFINTGSHSPWYKPPPVVEDYRSLDTMKGTWRTGYELSSFENYLQSMKYELEYLSRFILHWGDSNDLFVLIGDHQPPTMEMNLKGIIDLNAVPYHILSKDPALMKPFLDKGASPQLLPQRTDRINLSHEDIYELVLESLLGFE